MLTTIQTATFPTAKAPISIVTIGKNNWWIAREVSKALGYKHAARLSNLILGKWSDRMQPKKHYMLLEGELLEGFKSILEKSKSSELVPHGSTSEGQLTSHRRYFSLIKPNTPSLLLLTEAGLYRAILYSKSRVGDALMDFLTCEVLPMIRRTGVYVDKDHPLKSLIIGASITGMLEDTDQMEDNLEAAKLAYMQAKFHQGLAQAYKPISQRLAELEGC